VSPSIAHRIARWPALRRQFGRLVIMKEAYYDCKITSADELHGAHSGRVRLLFYESVLLCVTNAKLRMNAG
jgi:hypothetical protein